MNAILHPRLVPLARVLGALCLGLLLLLPLLGVRPVQLLQQGLAPAAPAPIYVDAGAVGLNNGSSWTNAYTSLQSTLAAAAPGNQIWVAWAAYRPSLCTDPADPRSAAFALKNGVAVYGGFAGDESSLSQRDWEEHTTVLTGDIGVIGNHSDDAYHVVTGSGANATARLDGFAITDGHATGDSTTPCGPRCGGGLYFIGGSPTLANLFIIENLASSNGGGLYNSSGGPSLVNVNFVGNQAYLGGGMYNLSSSPTLTDVIFSANQASTAGGLYNSDSSPSLTDVHFDGNSATMGGGGMYNNNESSPTLSGVTFVSNSALYGGGMSNSYSSPRLTDVHFDGNSATNGGGMNNENSNPTLTDVVFSANQAGNFGGGMNNLHSSPTLTDGTFSGNSATNGGGGMYNYDSSPSLTNITMSSNSAWAEGGALYNDTSTPLLQNSIVWGNHAPGSPSIFNQNSTPTIRYSLVEGDLPDGNHNLNVDPHFVIPPTCGADTICGDNPATPEDESDNDDSGDLRLQPASPAVDAGDNAADLDGEGPGTATVASVPADLAGQPRLAALRSPAAVVDMGAYETPNVPPHFTTWPTPVAQEDQPYTYAAGAADPDPPLDGALTFAAPTRPAWLAFTDSGTGSAALNGTPSNADVGAHSVVLTVQDSGGAGATQAYSLTVANVNDAPTFTSSPSLATTVGADYIYSVTTADVDAGDTRTLSAPTRPGWLTLVDHGDGAATLAGTPPAGSVGSHAVVLRVQDAGSLSAEQAFTLIVSAAPVQTGSVVGVVFADTDEDGEQDTSEPGIAQATVILQDTQAEAAGIDLRRQALTDAQGRYRFDALPPGAYTLHFTAPSGYRLPGPGTMSVAVQANQATTAPGCPMVPAAGQSTLYLPCVKR